MLGGSIFSDPLTLAPVVRHPRGHCARASVVRAYTRKRTRFRRAHRFAIPSTSATFLLSPFTASTPPCDTPRLRSFFPNHHAARDRQSSCRFRRDKSRRKRKKTQKIHRRVSDRLHVLSLTRRKSAVLFAKHHHDQNNTTRRFASSPARRCCRNDITSYRTLSRAGATTRKY